MRMRTFRQTFIAVVSNAIGRRKTWRALGFPLLVTVALALSACGSEPENSRVLAMIEAKYGVSVVSCRLAPAMTNDRGVERWRCDLSSPRTDTQSGLTGTSWCVTNASPDDEFESAHLAYLRSRSRPC
jgi:hypothetical protein